MFTLVNIERSVVILTRMQPDLIQLFFLAVPMLYVLSQDSNIEQLSN